MKLTRRTLWLSFPSLGVVAACGGSATVSSVPAITDARSVVGGVQRAFQSVTRMFPGAVPPAASAQIIGWLTSANGYADGLSPKASAGATATNLRGVESDIAAVLNTLAAILPAVPGIPPPVLLLFQAAVVLLPTLETAANRLAPSPIAGTPNASIVFRSGLTEDEARAVLMSGSR